MNFDSAPTQRKDLKAQIEGNIEDNKLKLLEAESMPLEGLYLQGANVNLSNLEMSPGTYAENGGVIIYVDTKGNKYATPGNKWSRELLQGAEIKEVTLGVPALSNGEIWGDSNRRESMPSWHRWRSLVEKSQQLVSRE